jgi:hypothetical protein
LNYHEGYTGADEEIDALNKRMDALEAKSKVGEAKQ